MFKLALSLGCTVKELLDRVDSYELSEWFEFFKLFPWGADIDRTRSAMLTTVIANNGLAVINPKKYNSKKYSLEDFAYPPLEKQQKRQTLEDHHRILAKIRGKIGRRDAN